MLSTFSSNAILAKTRAMYGQRLKEPDYKALLNCATVNDIAAYLKQHTWYAETLAPVNERDAHRGYMEMLMHQKLFHDFASLCRYELSVGEHFSDYLIARAEIEQIMHSLMLLAAGKSEAYVFSLPPYLSQHTHIDLHALSKTNNYGDFLAALGNTRYRRLLEPFSPSSNGEIPFAKIENKLYTVLYENVYNTINRYAHGKAKRELRELFDSYLDLENYARIWRMKHFYHMSGEEIRPLLMPFGSLTERQLNAMLEASDSSEVKELMGRTSRGKQAAKLEYNFVDELSLRVRYQKSRRAIRFSTHPSVIMLSYIFLMEIEMENITNIIEGIRYQIPKEETLKLLIYKKKKE